MHKCWWIFSRTYILLFEFAESTDTGLSLYIERYFTVQLKCSSVVESALGGCQNNSRATPMWDTFIIMVHKNIVAELLSLFINIPSEVN